jgi:hypothetical protein
VAAAEKMATADLIRAREKAATTDLCKAADPGNKSTQHEKTNLREKAAEGESNGPPRELDGAEIGSREGRQDRRRSRGRWVRWA